MSARTCLDCGAHVSRQSKGRCRPCSTAHLNSDPAIAERRRANLKSFQSRPEVKQRQRDSLARYMANMPERDREARRERGRRIYRDILNTPEIRAKSNSREARAQAGRARTETMLGWCPPELRDDYRALLMRRDLSAAEARAIIEQQIPGTQAHAARAIANTVDAQRIREERRRAQAY